jgi:predicted nucleic acid-binding protein
LILIDTNVFMYAGGGPHPNRDPSIELLRAASTGRVDAMIDAETLQEILYRYRAIRRWDIGNRVYALVRNAVPFVAPVTAEALDEARDLMDSIEDLSARDAIHAVVAIREADGRICSYDGHFDSVPGLMRLEPLAVPLRDRSQ